MKYLRPVLFAATLLLILAAACAPQGSSPIPLTGLLNNPSAATPAPTATIVATPTDTGTTQSIQSLTLSHPPMQAGSIDRYFDGALLDAVPNDGPFAMGSGVLGSPQYQVTVGNFWIYGTEVSNQMYAWCVSVGKCTPPNSKDNPNFSNPRFVSYPVVGV